MAPFDEVRARRMQDDDDSFLDWEGEATLFAEDDDEEEETDEESASLDNDEDEDEDEAYGDEDDDVDELDFG